MDYLLTESEDPIVFRMSDVECEGRESVDIVDRQLVVDTVDFGGFDVVESEKGEDIDDASGTVSVSASDASVASVGGSIAGAGANAETVKEINLAFQSNSLVEENSVRDYSKMYEYIAGRSCNAGSDDGRDHLVSPVKKNEEDELSIGSVRSVKEMNDAVQLNVLGAYSVGNTAHSLRSSSPSHLDGVFLGQGSDCSAGNDEDKEPSLGVVEDFELDSISQRGLNFDEPCNDSTGPSCCDGENTDNSESKESAEVDSTSMDEPSFSTPVPTKSLTSVPTMSFSLDSPSDDRRFLISENPIVVTPIEHGDVILLCSHPAVSNSFAAQKDQGQEALKKKTDSDNASEVLTVDLQPKLMKSLGEGEKTDLPDLVSVDSDDSGGSQTSGSLWNGLDVRDFDDEIFNENVDEKEDANDFVASDDWEPNDDDSDSTCSQPFGCCTVNVEVKSAILSASEKRMKPKETCELRLPDKGMLDATSDAGTDIGSNSNSSSLLGSFYFRDDVAIHTISFLEQSESGSSDELRDCNAEVGPSVLGGQTCESLEESQDKDYTESYVACDNEPVHPLSECDDIFAEEKSDVSANLYESSGAPSVVSDNGETNYDGLNMFWTHEWFELTHDEQTDALREDFNDAFSSAGSDCQSLGDSLLDFGNVEYSETDTQSFVLRSPLETVAEEGTEEESEDETFHHKATSFVANTVNDKDCDSCLGGIKRELSMQDSVVFRTSRRTKKKYMQVRKWAVVKAKSNKPSKCSLHRIRKNLRVKNMNTIDEENAKKSFPSSEVDECVNKALELLAKRSVESLLEQPGGDETVLLNDQSSVSYISKMSTTLSALSLTVDSSEYNDRDRLGILKDYLSPNAKESKMGEDMNGITNAPTIQDLTTKEDHCSIVSKSVTEEEHSYDEPVVEVIVTQEQHNHGNFAYENNKMPALNLCLDNLEPSQLDTLTQKLYYTNTELAETLAMTQCELEVANKKVEALALEKDELLISMGKFQYNESPTHRPGENDVKELLEWLGEKNDLLEL
eukprot:CCRYP_008562-RA/>CCRYP_008562-RA protein AED:0.01 eAED:0.01 QI:660/1/1/1/0/0/2/27/1017